MKIALVSPYDYPYPPGGVQQHIHNLAKQFSSKGHQVKIIAPSSRGEEELGGEIIKATGTIISVPLSGSIAHIGVSPRMYRRVKKVLERERFDIIHLHEPVQPLPLFTLRHSQTVNVGTFHAQREEHPIYRRGKRVLKLFMEKLDGKIAVSEAARDTIAPYFPGEYVIIPNGIDLELFSGPHVKPIDDYLDGRPNILFLGRLEKRKGFRYLLEAFARVRQEIPRARLLVVGAYDEDDKEPFVRYAREKRILGVRFIGPVSDEEKARYYASCDLFCAPSIGYESFGLVLLEAMAAGKPIVVSNITGYNNLVSDGEEGILVRPQNEYVLAEAIVHLLRSPSLREEMGRKGQAKAARYSWDKVSQEVLDYYQVVLARKRAAL